MKRFKMPEERVGSTAPARRLTAEHIIDVSKPWHLSYWSVILGVPENTLTPAVEVVGSDVNAVLQHLARPQ
jgi:hypothetical protein